MNTPTKDLEAIKKRFEKEFPGYPALQQIHIARKILAKEAETKGVSFLGHIRSQEK